MIGSTSETIAETLHPAVEAKRRSGLPEYNESPSDDVRAFRPKKGEWPCWRWDLHSDQRHTHVAELTLRRSAAGAGLDSLRVTRPGSRLC